MAPEGGQKKPASSSADQPPPKRPSQPPSIQEEDEDEATSPSAVIRPSVAKQGAAAEQPRYYGTLESSDTSTIRRRNPLSRGSSALASPAIRRDPTASPAVSSLSPQIPRAQRRPSTIRRQSTNRKPLPHRGEQFSVDDDPSEVEDDRGQNRNEDPPQLIKPSTVRRRTAHVPQLPRVDSQEEDEDDGGSIERRTTADIAQQEEDDNADEEDELTAAEEGDDDDDDLSDAESFTLRDRQLAINETHPFGIRIWKPALYKKNRSVEKNAEDDIHSSPSQIVGKWLWLFNCLWTIFFGWWLALAAALSALVCFIFSFEPSAAAYGRTFFGLASYLFWPFGQFVKLEQDDNYAEEDEGEGRSISEYERWQSGDLEYGRLMFGPNLAHGGSILGRSRDSIDSASERDSLLGRNGRPDHTDTDLTSRKRRLFGRGQWTLGRIIFFAFFYFFVAPLMLMVSLLCWFMVFWIPMGRVLTILFHHVRKRPLALTFHPDVSYARNTTKPSSIILCTYRAAGLKYWKYTLDGTNIFLINSLSVVVFVIVDYFFVSEILGVESWITSPALLFILGLVSIIPLAYFIGQAVASISAQSSMGLGAVINAFFSTVVEVFLYCVALKQGKSQLVEGSIVGSIFAGILLLPGLSMCFGAIRRKTQRFNVKSAGATSTMLLFAMIAAFGPTLFYKIYGAHELICKTCTNSVRDEPRDCRHCYFRQVAAPDDLFFVQAVQPYCWIAAVLLFLSYVIGLLFTLRTHAAVIWQTDLDEKKPVPVAPTTDVSPADTRGQSMHASQNLNGVGPQTPKPAIRDSQMYKRILDRSLRSAGLEPHNIEGVSEAASTAAREESGVATRDHVADDSLPHVVPPKIMSPDRVRSPEMRPVVSGLSEEDSQSLLRQVAAMASTAATVAARDVVNNPRQTSYMTSHSGKGDKRRPSTARLDTIFDAARSTEQQPTSVTAEHQDAGQGGGGHDAPNWSRTKSAAILLTATIAYAAVAEILVDTVDVILSSVEIDEKFLGITLFALVPNTTEFLNAISFAMNGNIALSMEIGSAYVLQVALLQIPALVLFSAVYQSHLNVENLADYTFNLIFPQWDMVTVILCVFLLSYVNTEGKSNYFKGSILVMAYLVILMGFYYSGFTGIDVLGVDPGDTLALTVNSWESLRASGGRSKAEL